MSEFFVSTDPTLLEREWLLLRMCDTYWGKGFYTAESFRAACDGSLCFGIYRRLPTMAEKITQVGFARVVTDSALTSVVTDVYVEDVYRNRGLGSTLMKAVLAHPRVAPTICVLATKDRASFYEKHGFERLKAMKKDPIK